MQWSKQEEFFFNTKLTQLPIELIIEYLFLKTKSERLQYGFFRRERVDQNNEWQNI